MTNSSPLIAFAILDHLNLLTLIFTEIYITQAVVSEISARDKPYSRELLTFSKGKVKSVQNTLAVQLLSKDVGLGEAETIALALENGIKDVFIDDSKGRRIATWNGLYPIGTIGVLLEAKRLGHINQVIKPNLDKLIAHRIRIGKNLYQQALKLAGESI